MWSCRSYFNNLFWGERIRRITGRCILTLESSLILFVLGMFGSGVASYFKFLRWLCVLNLILTVFIFSFICLPQVSTYTYRYNVSFCIVVFCGLVSIQWWRTWCSRKLHISRFISRGWPGMFCCFRLFCACHYVLVY